MNEEFFSKHQGFLLELANTEAGKFLLGTSSRKLPSGKIVKLTPSSIHQEIEGKKDLYTAKFFTCNSVAIMLSPIIEKIRIAHEEYKPIDNIYEAFLHYAGYYEKPNKYPQIYLNQITLSPVAGANSPCDGRVIYNASQPGISWATITTESSGTTATVTDSTANCIYAQSGNAGSTWVEVDRSIFNFNTIVLNGAVIQGSATINLYVNSFNNGYGGTPEIVIIPATPSGTANILDSDYGEIGYTDLAYLNIPSLTTSAYNSFTTSNIASDINQLGVTSFGVRSNWDISNAFGGSYSNSNTLAVNVNYADNGSNIPELIVTYSASGLFFSY